MGRRGVWVWVLICLFFAAASAGAEEMELFSGERFQGGPWRIRADQIIYEATTHTYSAVGQVEIRQGERRITADQVQVNEITKIAQVQGHVLFVLGEDILAGQAGYFNLATRCGELRGARLFLKRNHFHVDSPLIRKTGEHSYYTEKAVITTCDADLPVWSFSAQKLNVVLEGYATSPNTFLRLAGVPVFYLPYVILPAMTVRQSGFLMPNFGQHKAGGTILEIPLYWAINNQMDATLYQNIITNRGYQQGVEYRWRGHGDSAGNFHFAYLNDRDEQALTNHRYLVAGMLTQAWSPDWHTRLTLDRVSDINYLKNFNFGYLGLNRYSRELVQEFGRDLEQEEVNTRVSTLVNSGNLPWFNLSAYGRYYQRLRADDPNPYHKLPGLSLETVTYPIGKTPFLIGLNSSYIHYYHEPGQTGHRLDLHPQLWGQLQPLPGVSLDSRIGYRQTAFRIDKHISQGPPDNYLTRQLYDAKVSVASKWFKDYGRGDADQTYYRHTLRPEVSYWNMPRYNASRYPDFDPFDLGWREVTSRNLPIRDGDDPLGGVNAVTYGFSSNLLRRGENRQGQAVVRDLLWLRFSQSAFFTSTSMWLDGLSHHQNRFSDFLGESEFSPFRQLTLGLDLGASPYNEGFTRANTKLTIYDPARKNYLNVGYLFIKESANQVNVTTYLDLLPSVKTWVTSAHTFLTNKKLESRYGLVFQRQCWGVALSYTERPDDKRIGFTIIIPGLAEKFKRPPIIMPEGRENTF
ncbi:MAG: LPS assembly protein LptD [Thermodesulfobacteriota bacterium]